MIKKILLYIVIFIILLGLILGMIDYKRIQSFELPLFMIRTTSSNEDIQKYIGLGYKFKRYINVSFREPFYLDDDIRFGTWLFTWKVNSYVAILYVYNIKTQETKNCDKIPKFYYTEENKNIYTYCLNKIMVSNIEDFKDYINHNDINIDDFLKQLIFVEENKEKGYKIYRDPGKTRFISDGHTNNGLTVIKCNTKEGNKDIYIGPKWMNYEEGFCK